MNECDARPWLCVRDAPHIYTHTIRSSPCHHGLEAEVVHQEMHARRGPRDEDAEGRVAEAAGQALADGRAGRALQERGRARLEGPAVL